MQRIHHTVNFKLFENIFSQTNAKCTVNATGQLIYGTEP